MNRCRLRPWIRFLAVVIALALATLLGAPEVSLAQPQQPAHQLDISLSPQFSWMCAEITAGRDNPLTLTLTNTGTEPITDIQLSVPDAPARWTVTLDPGEIAMLEPGSSQNVTLTFRPHGMARRESRRGFTVWANSAEQQFPGFICVDVRLGALRLWSTVGLGLAVVVLFGAIFLHYERRAS
jgi:uncharacterized membrane protein